MRLKDIKEGYLGGIGRRKMKKEGKFYNYIMIKKNKINRL